MSSLRRGVPLLLSFLLITAALAIVGVVTPAWAADTVPDVVGLDLPAARKLLGKTGYLADVEYVPGEAAGRVLSQKPAAMTAAALGTAVHLRVGGEASPPASPPPAPEPPAPEPPAAPPAPEPGTP
ncbi:MAG: PASTA domain-containing protein, partial [Planctomycetota bacterium]